MKRNKGLSITLLLAASLTLSACAAQSSTQDTAEEIEAETPSGTASDNVSASAANVITVSTTSINAEDAFSNRDLSGEYDLDECETIVLSDSGISVSSGADVDGSTVTITSEGVYYVTGSLSDGMIIVDVDSSEKVQLVLDGVEITSAASAPIYVRQADKVFITLVDGTTSTLSNGGEFVAIDDNNIDAVIFSKDDLTLNGTGALVINSPAGHGIVSKDDLVITNGTYTITSASHGIAAEEGVAIADGTFTITAGKDGIQSIDDDDTEVGNIYIESGSFTISAGSDGMSAMNEISIAGGSISIAKSYEGLEACVIDISGGTISITASDDGLNATDKRSSTSSRGSMDTQSSACINISGGKVTVDASGDGLDSNGYIYVNGGEVYVSGATSSADGALDYGIDGVVSGGTVIAIGQSGMALNFGSSSTQGSIMVNTQSQQSAGTTVALLDSNGNTLASWTAPKSYNSVVISCAGISDGSTYTVKTGSDETSVTMSGLIYGSGSGMMGGGMQKGKGMGGGMQNGMMDGGRMNNSMQDNAAPDDSNAPSGNEMPDDGNMPSIDDMPSDGGMPSDAGMPNGKGMGGGRR